MLSAQVLGSCLGWELGLTDIAEVSSQVHGLPWHGERQPDELSLWLDVPLSLEPHLELLTPGQRPSPPSGLHRYLPLISLHSLTPAPVPLCTRNGL